MTTSRRPTRTEKTAGDRRPRRPACGFRASVGGPWFLVCITCLLLVAIPAVAQEASPGGESTESTESTDPTADPLLYGLDPLLLRTRDPRLLGVDRLVLRDQLVGQGIEPTDGAVQPTVGTVLHAALVERKSWSLELEKETSEFNVLTGTYVSYRYPDWFFLFPEVRTLPGGYSYYPPRPVDSADVVVLVDDAEAALLRDLAVRNELKRRDKFNVSGGSRAAGRDEGLINLTIPVKLPRTLEKVIGRGEKTSIKITGREHISIRGETTRSNQFTPNERVQSQSWFPDLDMEQQLQVNLSGQIGEKIFIEVDHNSEAIGPEATKIKLSYQGDEDEIIHSIETGDVGLTLPGGQLLGYNSNKAGLFGIKVTGQVGPAEFTTVASKQKAESDSKTFNSRGGQVAEHEILASNYLNNRFFRLDLQPYPATGDYPNGYHEAFGYTTPDSPGRGLDEYIDVTSIRIYRNLGSSPRQSGDVDFAAAAIDPTGEWDRGGYITGISGDDVNWVSAWTWRPVEATLLRDTDGNLVAVDMRQEMLDDDILAAVYHVVDSEGNFLYAVGDHPDLGGERGLEVGAQAYYRFKLLKPEQRDAFTFQYVLRNIYPLGGTNIDAESFELRIESRDISLDQPDQHGTQGLTLLRVFGLDRENPQGDLIPDGVVDKHRNVIFDLEAGLLKFPLDFPFPFNAEEDVYEVFADPDADQWEWDATYAEDGSLTGPATELAQSLTDSVFFYDWETRPQDYDNSAKFKLVATHAAASSVIQLGASNIEEGSETVTLDGQTLERGVDYEIDYLFGTVELKGEAAGRLTPDSNIGVNYQYSPFFGGGQSSLLGLNLGFDLGRESKLSTTWLYESNSIVGDKAKLGEEPSRTLVGNLQLNHTFKSNLLTDFANIIARGRRDQESTLAFSGEAAISIPNPNTKDLAYLEDFEGAASTDIVTLGRLGWYRASQPLDSVNQDTLSAARRLDTIRWYVPRTRVLRRWLNPELVGQERDETQQAIELFLREDDAEGWQGEHWGGIMRGLGRAGLDLSQSQFIEIWINDFDQQLSDRRGIVHIDFGTISEDFAWPEHDSGPEYGTPQFEDRNQDGTFSTLTEDVGLDAIIDPETNDVEREGGAYSAEYNNDDDPYPYINNTAANNYEDSEDLNGDTRFNTSNGYFSVAIDLASTEALVDVARDYPEENLEGTAWRKYRIRLDAADVALLSDNTTTADIAAVKHVRIWYEDPGLAAPEEVRLQVSELAFLGSRWEREGIRKTDTEVILPPDPTGTESFFIGEINNKDNPDYHPPFPVREEAGIPEKETSLVVDFTDLEPDHMLRIQKQVSAQGDDYTRYETLSWWWHCGSPDVADLDMFFRIGADSTNYYEVALRFVDTSERQGWRNVQLNVADLTNVKTMESDDDDVIRGEVADAVDGQLYRVTVKGRPDLRRVLRYYMGVANNTRRTVSGQMWVNDVTLEGAKRDIGLAGKVGLRLNMANVFKVDFDWDRRDAEYHGLNEETGQGAVTENWSLSTSFKIDDFLPLFGFQLPVSYSRRSTTSRPKYEVNSDVEILDEDRRNFYSSVEDRESFSARLSRSQSRHFLPRYLLDPWTVQFSGSRTDRNTPTETAEQVSLQGSLNYNLQIQSDFGTGSLPLVKAVPLLGSVRLLPNRVAGSASFTYTDRTGVRRDLDGTEYPPTATKNKPATLTGDLEYRPLTVVTVNYKNRSERDLLRRQEWNGINVGEQNKFSQDFTINFTVPKATQLPQGAIYAPLRTTVRALNKMRPSLSYQGSYVNDTNPGIQQEGDPDDVHSISNANDWQARAQVPAGDVFKDLFPERPKTGAAEQALQNEVALVMQDARTDTSLAFKPERVDGYEDMSREDQQLEEDEWYREKAEERMLAEGRELPGGGGILSPRDLVEPLLGALRGIEPVTISYTRNRGSGFGRLSGADPGLSYYLGFNTQPDLPDSAYYTHRYTESDNFTVSSKTRLTRDLQLDIKYTLTQSTQIANGEQTWNYSQDWPDMRFNLTGLERWGVFGGDPEDRNAGWFRSSSIDVSYKHSKSVPNYTETFHNPRRSSTVSPRWSMTFQGGMSITLNSSLSTENMVSSGATTDTRRFQVGAQLQHEIQAQAFLAKLGLYRPGNQPTMNVSLDLRYQRNTTERDVEGSNFEQAVQGTQNITVSPRFSYNITRNLSGAFNMNFSQNKNLATDLVNTTIGIGVEATFVF